MLPVLWTRQFHFITLLMEYGIGCELFCVKQDRDKTNEIWLCGWSGAFIASGGEPSVGSNIMDVTYRIQGWNFVHAQPPDLGRGLLFDCLFLWHVSGVLDILTHTVNVDRCSHLVHTSWLISIQDYHALHLDL